jgi:hypothetical protein
MTDQPELFAQAPDEPTTSLEDQRIAREEQARRDVLRRMKDQRAAWLDTMRAELAKVFEYRVLAWYPDEAYVTADDARNLMRAYPERFALPAGASMNTLGALFLTKEWAPLDTTPGGRAVATHISTTPGSKGNHLVRWALRANEDTETSEAA